MNRLENPKSIYVSLNFCFFKFIIVVVVVVVVEPTTWLHKNSNSWTFNTCSASQGSLNITPYSALHSSEGLAVAVHLLCINNRYGEAKVHCTTSCYKRTKCWDTSTNCTTDYFRNKCHSKWNHEFQWLVDTEYFKGVTNNMIEYQKHYITLFSAIKWPQLMNHDVAWS
jgi:hypothetical protein